MDYKTVSLSDQVFEHLESNILSGKYPRGAIITELQLHTNPMLVRFTSFCSLVVNADQNLTLRTADLDSSAL